ncbi:MAG TPA: tubulin-like doman-containing protein [Alphaproteobacteria bacterium]|nr:tubulin-like doman-containing protein [Alphaproteobacteria bacterium]
MKRAASSIAELRPTLVVGIGGTGYLGVTAIKEKMLRMLPELVEEGFVRFQVIDTPSQKIRKLPPSEYFSCGGYNANRILDAMHREHTYEHIRPWFPPTLRPGQISSGAEGIRPVGRLCFFLRRRRIEEILVGKMRALLDESLPRRAAELGVRYITGEGLDIHVISSICGGTGSGMLLDLVYNLHWWAGKLTDGVRVDGHLVLPEAFNVIGSKDKLRKNGYATLAEIDYFTRTGEWRADYGDEMMELTNQAPFRYTYLLDGQTEEGTIDIESLAGVIGEAVLTFIYSPVGKQIEERAANYLPAELQTLDDRGMICAYSTYGISVGEIPFDEGVLRAAITGCLSGVPVSPEVVREEIDHFVRGHEIRLDLLESMEPQIRPIEWGRELPRKAGDLNPYIRLFERQVSNYLEAYEGELVKARERLEALDMAFRSALKERVWEIIERPGQRYPMALEFLKALRTPVEAIERHCLEQIERLAKAARTAGEDFRNETLEHAVVNGQLATFAERLQTYQRLEKQLHFYRSLRKFAFEATEFLKTVTTNLDTLQREIGRLAEAQNQSWDGQYRVNARFPICRFDDVQQLVLPKVEEAVTLFLRETKRLHLDMLVGEDPQGPRSLAEQIHHLATACYREMAQMLDYEDILFRASNVEETLEAQINRASPNWKIDPAYPMMNNIVEASAFGHFITSRTGALLTQLGLTHLEPSNTYDSDQLIIFRTAHGASLRGLQRLRDYQELYLSENPEERARLHINRTMQIPLIVPRAEEKSPTLRAFALACCLRLIYQDLHDFYLDEESAPLGRGRRQAYLTFEHRYQDPSSTFREEIEEMLEKKMREVKGIADNSALAAALDKHVTNLSIMAAEMRKDRDAHSPEDVEQILLERMVLQREIKRLVPEWNHHKREPGND